VRNFPIGNTNPPTAAFAPPLSTGHELPYAISYCGGTLAVGYISDGSGSGRSEAGSYSTSGSPFGAPYGGSIGGAINNLHASACAPNGDVFVATDISLQEYAAAAGTAIAFPAGSFAGLTPPIYGVGVGAASGLNSPEGLIYSNGSLY